MWKKAGSYSLEVPVASRRSGGTFHIEFDGKDVTGPITIPDTGGWDKLQTLSFTGVTLKKGRQMMKLVMDKTEKTGESAISISSVSQKNKPRT